MSTGTKNIFSSNRDGQAQTQRMPAMLHPEKAPVDNRTTRDMLEYIFTISRDIKYFDQTNPQKIELISNDGNWQELLSYNQTDFAALWARLEELKNRKILPPHISLLLGFLELYNEPKRLMNTITGRHLDFYYHEVLGLKKNSSVADKVHVVFELKKNISPALLKASETKLTAGKDDLKKELVYQLTHDIIINNSKVEQMKSLLVDVNNKNHLRFASVANSADGLGGELDKNKSKWNAFGHDALPLSNLGFCLASDVLLMKEGDRKIIVKLQLNGEITNVKNGDAIHGLLNVSVTAEKGWTDHKTVSPVITIISDKSTELAIEFSIAADEPAIVAYNTAIHGSGYITNKPVLKILFNSKLKIGYNNFKKANLASGTINVEVKGMSNLQLENDFGLLNSKKPFMPFGPMPENGANFWIGSEEIFSKQLAKLVLNIEWKNIPQANLGTYYGGYFDSDFDNHRFTVNATFKDAAGWKEKNNTQYLFDKQDATKKDEDNFSTHIRFLKDARSVKINRLVLPEDFSEIIFRSSGTTIRQELAYKSKQFSISGKFAMLENIYKIVPLIKMNYLANRHHEANAILREGFLHLALDRGFLFRRYREVFTKQVLSSNNNPINEPFAPEMQRLTLDYNASTGEISFTDQSLKDYSDTDLEFFHIGPFGQMREHAYTRKQSGILFSNFVKLLPQYNSEGNFYIGLSGISANESVCILFQCAEGSADPLLQKVDLNWSVLCDNYWKKLKPTDFIFDTTNDFLTSGVVKLIIPREATTENTIMPDGLLWLKVSIAKDANAVCNLIDVKSNAAIGIFEDHENDPLHLQKPLKAGTVAKLQTQNGAIKSITQPYASFGGKMQENDQAYYTRVSERLRHKERAITVWDYERLLLQHFPSVYKVKCIQHASGISFAEAGHTLIVVIPELTNQNSVNPFQPRLDKNTLDEILTFLNKHSTGWATHHVKNPDYVPIQIRLEVKMKIGYEFNYYSTELDRVLKNYLSPWLNGSAADIHFGGKITESQIVKFVEDQEYVDYITGLQLFQSADGGESFQLTKHYAEASGPASILVSHTVHDIKQSKNG